MKKVYVLGFVFLLTGCAFQVFTYDQNLKNSQKFEDFQIEQISNFTSVSMEEFKFLYDTGKFTVVDIRTPEEIEQGKLFPEALEINFYDKNFSEQIKRLDSSKKYLLYCRSGKRSGKTLKLFNEMGFEEAYDLLGGIKNWRL